MEAAREGSASRSAPPGHYLHGAQIVPPDTWRPSALQTAEAALKEVQKSVVGFKAPQGKDLSTALRQYAEVAQGGRWNLKQDIRGAAEQERERLEAGLAGTKPRKPTKKRSAERSPLGRPQGTPPPGAAALEEAAHSGKRPQHLLPGVLLSCAGWPSKLQSKSSHRASCLWEAAGRGAAPALQEGHIQASRRTAPVGGYAVQLWKAPM